MPSSSATCSVNGSQPRGAEGVRGSMKRRHRLRGYYGAPRREPARRRRRRGTRRSPSSQDADGDGELRELKGRRRARQWWWLFLLLAGSGALASRARRRIRKIEYSQGVARSRRRKGRDSAARPRRCAIRQCRHPELHSVMLPQYRRGRSRPSSTTSAPCRATRATAAL
jgi:hypothetical protein